MDELPETRQIGLIVLSTNIVAAYVANNSVPASDLATLLTMVHGALIGLGRIDIATEAPVKKITFAQIRKPITREALISFADGKAYKMLKRHLAVNGLTPKAYRIKWGLPADYPMTAASFSEAGAAHAKNSGLGQSRRRSAMGVVVSSETAAAASKAKRGRKKAADAAPMK